MSNRKYYIIIGSKTFFDDYIKDAGIMSDSETFAKLVKESDECRINGKSFNNWSNSLIMKNDSYSSIVEQAHDRLGVLIEELTLDDAHIFVHNPPLNLHKYLLEQSKSKDIELQEIRQKYSFEREEKNFVKKIEEISENIIGQNSAIMEITKSMWYLTKVNREKPYVIMLYGNSSVGKTQLVREIGSKFYNNELYEKHLSMFKNDSYSDYFFGEKPNRISMGYELAERTSNLIFFDELDKCPEHFLSAFYTLFDNSIFKDKTYEIDMSNTLIILTSNYMSENEMKNRLGLPIFYRIDKFIEFRDFSSETIYQVVMKEIEDRREEYSEYIDSKILYKAVSKIINLENENARTIKYKIQQVIEEILYLDIKNNNINYD